MKKKPFNDESKQLVQEFMQEAAGADEVAVEELGPEPLDRADHTQFDLLPDEYQEVCVDGALPLEYVGDHWILMVSTNHWEAEFGTTDGDRLRANWESNRTERLSLQTVRSMKGGWLPVLCPDGRCLAVKILNEEL